MSDRQLVFFFFQLLILTTDFFAVVVPLVVTHPIFHEKRTTITRQRWNPWCRQKNIIVKTTAANNSSLRAENSVASCPFSRTFPRYRIDLSSIKDDDNIKSKISWPWQRAWIKNRIEQKAKEMDAEWFWIEKMQSPDASALLWKTASQSMATIKSGSANLSRVILMAFPDVRPLVIRQWLDIFHWLQQIPDIAQDVVIDCCFELEGNNVPCIIMNVQKTTERIPKLHDHESVTIHTKAWVKRILVEQGICPFTKSVTMSGQGLGDLGIPVGSIAYHTCSADSTSVSGICTLMADTWEAICDMLAKGPKGKEGVSSILLAAPSFDDDFALWSGPVFCLLENQVIAAELTDRIGVVCFHPHYQTPDGQSFPGFGHMHSVPRLQQWMAEYQSEKPSSSSSSEQPLSSYSWSDIAAGGAWQRRTPHATINVLRADQLAVAEGRRSTPRLYSENIQRLLRIGSERLQIDLDKERHLTDGQ
jgi:hypothetical protein